MSAAATEDDAIKTFFEDAPGAWMQSGPALVEQVRFRTSFAHKTKSCSRRRVVAAGRPRRETDRLRALGPGKTSRRASRNPRAYPHQEARSFIPKLVEIGCACGVAILFVRTPAGCRASGATHFEADDKAIIQLSFRYRADDHFWFTVFHEIGHLLLHPNSLLFVEGEDYETTEEKSEANRFASALLIPDEVEAELRSLRRDFRAYARLAKRIGISPGVLVGQMQNRGLLQHHQMNFLKERYDWADVADFTL